MFTDEQINKLTYQIVMNYNSTKFENSRDIHPGILQDAVKNALKSMEE